MLAAFFLGSLFDAIRNLFDSVIDCKDRIWWDFFFKGEKEKVEQMDGYYFSYYQFDANAAIASFILVPVFICTGLSWFSLIPAVVGVICFADAVSLRKEIKRLAQEYLSNCSDQSSALPHDHVNARLQPSSVCGGVGVFAIKSIKKEALVFPGDNVEMVWISKTKLESANLIYCGQETI